MARPSPDQRFDVAYHGDRVTIDYHFCREWEDDVGCYGTNPNHGYSFDDACDEVASWYERRAKEWRERTHPDIQYFLNPPEGINR